VTIGLSRRLRAMAVAAAAALAVLAASGPAWAASYTVQQGDTFWSLARRFGVSIASLEAANPAVSAFDLYPGLQLTIPGATGATASGAGTPALSSSAIDLIAQVAVAEEGNHTFEDMVGVADVVLHRLQAPGFPKTVAGVIFQPWAFTSVANGYFFDVSPTGRAIQAVRDALAGWDPTHGALYFYDPGPGVTDAWIYTQPVTAVIDGTVYAR
jgi:N-acetylmuramoyl-L-alanine amidase